MSDRIDEIESRLGEMGRPQAPEAPVAPEAPAAPEAPVSPDPTKDGEADSAKDGEAPALRPPEPPSEAAAAEHAEGELRIPEGYGVLAGGADGRRAVGIVVSRFNGDITNRLLERALAELEEVGVPREAIMVMPVPGAFELPLATMALAKTRRYACIVALGCVIRGETPHFDLIAGEAASGLQLAAIETGVPVAFGVLTVDNREQAEERIDRAADAVRSALEMADVFSQLRAQAAGPLR
jgi:6,7-dimethyl-8-ribityllumazine synthase